jgi:hypothetical protein
MNKPNPVPLSDFVANFVNNLGNISESIPVPVSFILTVTSPILYSKITYIVSSSFVNFEALFNKLEMTCDILFLSASMGKRSAFWWSLLMEGNKQENSILR